jgi:hypothetical protein
VAAPDGTRAVLLLADYITADASGKLTVVGAGFTVAAVQQTGTTSPQYLAGLIDVPSSHAGRQLAVTVELRDETDDAVARIPGPSGQPEALRIQQLMLVERPQLPGVAVPEGMFCRVQFLLGFPNGLPLPPNREYAWKLEIDGTRLKSWQARFYVAGPPPPPIIGGPAGPSSIPNISLPAEQDDEED